MSRQQAKDDLAEVRAYAESRATEATEAALRIFYRAAAAVLGDALKRQQEEAVDA